jgi:hypothetical protein
VKFEKFTGKGAQPLFMSVVKFETG